MLQMFPDIVLQTTTLFLYLLNYFTFCLFRWAQVTKELRGALIELHQEKRKNRSGEESNLSAHEQANVKNKPGALWDEKENRLMGTEDDASSANTSLRLPAAFTSAEERTPGEGPQERTESPSHTHETQQELLLASEQEKQAADTSKLRRDLKDDEQLQTLQVEYTAGCCPTSSAHLCLAPKMG